jgi:DNA-binding NtrC family response regulator
MATATTRASIPVSRIPVSRIPVPRTAVLASADISFRQRVRDALTSLRWQVREAAGGAEALAHLDASPAETMILDSWLPDLEVQEFIAEFRRLHPGVDLVTVDDSVAVRDTARSPRRNEVLLALRRGQDADGAAWNSAPVIERGTSPALLSHSTETDAAARQSAASLREGFAEPDAAQRSKPAISPSCRLPEFIGEHPLMLEVSRRVRLAAPHPTAVLIQGPTGTGKELVARALHRLSPRASRPFLALNCAAIPESLLEAELFGHARGAFTGAVQGRVGRIEAAHGGTLFLDEIGEMPLALQAKLLRFVESGELQRVGENDSSNEQSVATELVGIRDEVLSLANSSYLGQTSLPEAREGHSRSHSTPRPRPTRSPTRATIM